MANRSTGGKATRVAGLVAVTGLLWLGSAGSAGAATLPDPLAGPLTSVTDPTTATVTQLLGGNAAPAPSAPAVPALPSPPAPPALPALPGLPGGGSGDGSGEGAQDGSGVSAQADAPAGDDLAAVDAAVAEFLGVCARVPQGVVPVRADIVVLDRNVIAELVDAGVPLQPLVVPCPRTAEAPATPPRSAVPSATDANPQGPADPRSGLPTSLAFTGIEIAPTLLLAGGLIALGIAFLRRAHQLAVVR